MAIICGETAEEIRERDLTHFGYTGEQDKFRDMYSIDKDVSKYFFGCEDANHYNNRAAWFITVTGKTS